MILYNWLLTIQSHRLFSTVGDIINSKQAALLPENVNKLVFLHENMPPVHLNVCLNANVMLVRLSFFLVISIYVLSS